MRSRRGDDDDDSRRGPRVPRLVRAALENLREVAADRLKGDADAEAKVVEVLARAAAELKKSLTRHDLRRGRSRASAPDGGGPPPRSITDDFDFGRTAGGLAERAGHIELIAAVLAAERDAADLDGGAARTAATRTTAPRCPAEALRVTAIFISSITTAALFRGAAESAPTCGPAKSAVAVPPGRREARKRDDPEHQREQRQRAEQHAAEREMLSRHTPRRTSVRDCMLIG